MAKVILINGSPREDGCTARALEEMMRIFSEEGIESELINIGKKDIRGCVACNGCQKLGRCVYNDDLVNEVAAKFENADGLVVGSPVYYASPNGSLISFNSRMISNFKQQVRELLFRALNRRSQLKSYNKEGFYEMMKYYPLALPKIYVSLFD